MFRIIALVMFLAITGCSALDPVAVSSIDMNIQEKLIFSANSKDTVSAVKSSFQAKGWKLLYEGETLPDRNYSSFSNMSHNPFKEDSKNNYDQIAIDKTLRADAAPSYYLQAKTPTSAFSFGAEIFVVVFEIESEGTILSMAASSGQALEKDKLGPYLTDLTQIIGEKID